MATKTKLAIRPADGADEHQVQQLWDDCGLSRAESDEWAALLSGTSAAVLVAEDGGQLIGACIASFDGWRAYIYHVAVDPEHRRLGVAYDLMQEAEHYLVSAGARFVYVTVHEENTEGLALVGSTGYLPDGEIVLGKRLANRPV